MVKNKNIKFLLFFSGKLYLLANRNKNTTQPILINLGQFSLSSGDTNGFLYEWCTRGT